MEIEVNSYHRLTVKLWNEAVNMATIVGRKVHITNVRSETFNGRTSVKTTMQSQMEVL